MKRFPIYALAVLSLLLIAPASWGATYYKLSTGTAANKEAASGPCTTAANCMSFSTYAGETFVDGDVIVHCHTPIGIPGKILSESFIDASQTLSIPAAGSYALLETGDKILLETGDKLLLQ